MSWAVGFDEYWNRDIGYGVPSICDHPDCNVKIDRGLAFVCGGEPYGGENGCGLYFCPKHLTASSECHQHCERCADGNSPFTPKPDTAVWVEHKLTDDSWREWREQNPEEVSRLLGKV